MSIFIPEPIAFEWDDGNKDKNWRKHQVRFSEAEEVLSNKPLVIFEDHTHSQSEKRYGVLGRTSKERLLSMTYTLRNNKIRIITARDMSKKERKIYEKNTE